MKTDITVEERPVVALWMSGISELVEVDPQFSVDIRKMKLGKTCKRSLLKPGCRDTTIVGTNSVRRSCMALFLDDHQWPADLLREVKQCKSTVYSKGKWTTLYNIKLSPLQGLT